MEVLKNDFIYKGTRILLGGEKRKLINKMIDILLREGFTEIELPIIQFQHIFANKVGAENQHMMFTFSDKKGRELCLAPEYTAVIQQSLKDYTKYQKDVKLFYVQECFRGEKPQEGRYRQFTQLGVEILNPTKDHNLSGLAISLILQKTTKNLKINRDVTRGLDYYEQGKGFEIICEDLGAQKQICGGGKYEGGEGFALGIDRLMLLKN